jgi:hypothetical protein
MKMSRMHIKCPQCGHSAKLDDVPTRELGNNWENFKKLQIDLGYKSQYIYIGGSHPTHIKNTKVGFINITDKGFIACTECDCKRMSVQVLKEEE